MTTIRTEEDFIRVMDSNPAFLEAVRSRLLTREILELPATVQRLTDTVERFIESTNRRLDSLTEDVGTLKEDVGTLTTKVDSLTEDMGTLTTKVDSLTEDVGTLKVDVGDIRGVHARDRAIRRATLIPRKMGFQLKRVLSIDEIVAIVDGADTSSVSRDDLISFEEADLIMLATDGKGSDCYVPVEVSYTIYPKDTDRAIRNAGFLTSWTGLTAHPGVAGIRVNWRAEAAVESGDVFFYRIPQQALGAG